MDLSGKQMARAQVSLSALIQAQSHVNDLARIESGLGRYSTGMLFRIVGDGSPRLCDVETIGSKLFRVARVNPAPYVC
jgi:hypothetical protein